MTNFKRNTHDCYFCYLFQNKLPSLGVYLFTRLLPEQIILGLAATTVVLSGMSLVTTHPAPILQFLPIVTFPIILAPAPIKTPSLITGAPYPLLSRNVLLPIVTCWYIITSFPIFAELEIKTPL